jgi:uncharacterized protein YdiU (UPF0061 family)
LLDSDDKAAIDQATLILNEFTDQYDAYWLHGMRRKLGLLDDVQADDLQLANQFLAALEGQNADYTLAFRALAAAARGDDAPIHALLENPSAYDAWAPQWRQRISDPVASAAAMNAVNPLYIPRNHQVEAALGAAVESGDLTPFERLLEVLAAPFTERPGLESYTLPAPPESAPYRTFCGT